MEVIKAPAKAQVFYDMPASEYHSDADGPRLSQSLATLCVQKSELHAYAAHPLMGLAPYTYEASDDDGTLIHALVLEPDSAWIEEYDYKDWRTNEAKGDKRSAIARGQIPVLKEKLGAYKYKAEAIRQRFAGHPTHPIEFSGDSEVVIYWEEPGPFGPVRCRCRLDHLRSESGWLVITDLKSGESVAGDDLRSSCWRYRYDIQEAAYTRAVTAAWPDMAGRVRFEFAFLELDKPYAVNPITLSGKFKRMGERGWLRGVDRWARGLRSNEWPGYNGGVIDPPAWAEAREMGDEE